MVKALSMRPLPALLLALLAFTASAASIAQSDFAQPPAPHMEDYYVVGDAPARQLKGADVTIIYFFDYQCPACRQFHAGVRAVFAADRKLRIIYRDTPIFGPRSVAAARAAIAAKYQGRHDAFHNALMTQPLPLDDEAIRAAAARAGVNWPRLQRDLALHGKAIDAQIAQNENLSEAAGISGTPAFIIGETLADGALDAKTLRAEIADARKKR